MKLFEWSKRVYNYLASLITSSPEDTSESAGIYAIENTVTGEFYIGSATNVGVRWSVHTYLLYSNRHRCASLQRAWNKYGPGAFVFHFVEAVPVQLLIPQEQLWVTMAAPAYKIAKAKKRTPARSNGA